jgi:RNA-directed DNA polymerase
MDWVIDLDIRDFFRSLDHELMMKSLQHRTEVQWVHLYAERWLKAPLQREDGSMVPRVSGTPQGGVISPLLANLYMHYAFDEWMRRNFPRVLFERYADDVVIHSSQHRNGMAYCHSVSVPFSIRRSYWTVRLTVPELTTR